MAPQIPLPRQLFHDLLQVLADASEPIPRREAADRVADRIGLTEEQREEMLPSGTARRYRHRTGWAFNVVKNAGLATSPQRGVWAITDAGRAFLSEHADGLTDEEQLALTREANASARRRREASGSEPPTAGVDEDDTSSLSPEERIDAALREHDQAVATELLELIRAAAPSFFERLVLDLLHAMGYGGSRSALQQTGQSGDGGIDGVISLDRLGLEKVYVQAKRLAEGNNVGRPALQAFFGALAGRHANKGVFLTTSSFTRDATEFASTVSNSIVLVDGDRLAQLMIEFGVGVGNVRSFRLVAVDSDYFDEG